MKLSMNRNILEVRKETDRVSREKATLRACISRLVDEYKVVTHLDLGNVPAKQPT